MFGQVGSSVGGDIPLIGMLRKLMPYRVPMTILIGLYILTPYPKTLHSNRDLTCNLTGI